MTAALDTARAGRARTVGVHLRRVGAGSVDELHALPALRDWPRVPLAIAIGDLILARAVTVGADCRLRPILNEVSRAA